MAWNLQPYLDKANAYLSQFSWNPEYQQIAATGSIDALKEFAARAPTQYADFGQKGSDIVGSYIVNIQDQRARASSLWRKIGGVSAGIAKVGIVAGFSYAAGSVIAGAATAGSTTAAVAEGTAAAEGGGAAVGAYG